MAAERVSLPGWPESLSSWPDTPPTEGPTVIKSGTKLYGGKIMRKIFHFHRQKKCSIKQKSIFIMIRSNLPSTKCGSELACIRHKHRADCNTVHYSIHTTSQTKRPQMVPFLMAGHTYCLGNSYIIMATYCTNENKIFLFYKGLGKLISSKKIFLAVHNITIFTWSDIALE